MGQHLADHGDRAKAGVQLDPLATGDDGLAIQCGSVITQKTAQLLHRDGGEQGLRLGGLCQILGHEQALGQRATGQAGGVFTALPHALRIPRP